MTLRLLVFDAYDRAGRRALLEAGCTEAGQLYADLLRRLRPDAEVDVALPADGEPQLGDRLGGYDGVCWTGSSLTIHREGDARVGCQLELCRAAFERGIPQFGSCFGAQLAVTTAGGRCAPSPRGREFGVSVDIVQTAAGADHPMFEGKAQRFDALTSHEDEIVELPPGATVLASNGWSPVQAVDVAYLAGTFWAVQYHPEYDLREIAGLCELRAEQLIAQGHFADRQAADDWAREMERAHRVPGEPIRGRPDERPEIENWLRRQVEDAAAG
jgi:GMP synthase (glutamine-hydrolysing)